MKNGFCPYCDQPRPGFQNPASSTAWLLLMVVNAIVGICLWPLWFALPLWLGGWILDATVQTAKGSTCTECGTKLMRSRPAPPHPPAPKIEAEPVADPEPKRRRRR